MAISVGAVGTTVTTSSSSSSATAIPDNSAGERAKYVRVVADTSAHIKFGSSSVAATANDAMITSTPSVFQVRGFTHFAVIEEGTGAKVNVVPVDDE